MDRGAPGLLAEGGAVHLRRDGFPPYGGPDRRSGGSPAQRETEVIYFAHLRAQREKSLSARRGGFCSAQRSVVGDSISMRVCGGFFLIEF